MMSVRVLTYTHEHTFKTPCDLRRRRHGLPHVPLWLASIWRRKHCWTWASNQPTARPPRLTGLGKVSYDIIPNRCQSDSRLTGTGKVANNSDPARSTMLQHSYNEEERLKPAQPPIHILAPHELLLVRKIAPFD